MLVTLEINSNFHKFDPFKKASYNRLNNLDSPAKNLIKHL